MAAGMETERATMQKTMFKLVKASCGHPDVGTCWEIHADQHLKEFGFVSIAGSWGSCYLHKDFKYYLTVYFHAFMMKRKSESFKRAWSLIREKLNIDWPEPFGFYFGCTHSEKKVVVNGVKVHHLV